MLSMTDLLMKSKSGTGKTLVFCTIILERYNASIQTPQSLIVVPTREVAMQIESNLNMIGASCKGWYAFSSRGLYAVILLLIKFTYEYVSIKGIASYSQLYSLSQHMHNALGEVMFIFAVATKNNLEPLFSLVTLRIKTDC